MSNEKSKSNANENVVLKLVVEGGEDAERHREEQLGREAAAEEEPELVARAEARQRRPDVRPPAADTP